MVHKCKIIISPENFIFSKFWFLGLLGGSKGKKWSKLTKNSFYCALCLRNHASYDLHLWYIYVKGWYPQIFLHFFQVFVSSVSIGVKGQKMAQNDKKLCLLHSISQEAYIIWLWFLVYIYKMMASRCFFHFSQILVFRVALW